MIPASLISTLLTKNVAVTLIRSNKNVNLLVKATGSDGGSNSAFLDSSANALTVTSAGGVTQGSFSPFSPNGWAASFSGTPDYIVTASTPLLNFAERDFTAECWVHPLGLAQQAELIFISTNTIDSWASAHSWDLSISSDNFPILEYRLFSGSFTFIKSNLAIDVTSWNHVAVTFDHVTRAVTFYVNGKKSNTTIATDAVFINLNSVCTIGRTAPLVPAPYVFALKGLMSNVRITRSVIYSEAFVPSTTPLRALYDTVLLTLQDNHFVDNAVGGLSLSLYGPKIVPVSPFAAIPYEASLHGGSYLFDGTSGRLTSAPATALQLGNANFTIEMWVYFNSVAANQRIAGGDSFDATSNLSWALYTPVAGVLRYYLASVSTSWDLAGNAPADVGPISPYQWYHIAIVRTGNVVTPYLNGKSVGWPVNVGTKAIYPTLAGVTLGTNQGSWFNGHIAGFRLTPGTALYTAPFAVPTSIPTILSGTQLLLQGANAKVYDAATNSDLSLYGNARVSSTIKKFSPSIYLDGAGDYLIANGVYPSLLCGNFTIEAWVYPTALTGIRSIISNWTQLSASTGFTMRLDNGVPGFAFSPQSTTAILLSSSAGTLKVNTWQHIAVVRTGNTFLLFVDGTVTATATNASVGVPFVVGRPIIGNYYGPSGSYPASGVVDFAGYVEDARLSTRALYTASIDVPQSGLPTSPQSDPYYSTNTLMVRAAGPVGANNLSFTNEGNGSALTVGTAGVVTQGSFSPFNPNGWATVLNPIMSLTAPASASVSGTGDFTIELFLFPHVFYTSYTVFLANDTGGGFSSSINSTGTIGFGRSLVANDGTTSLKVNFGAWNHIAYVRKSGTFTIYINGAVGLTLANTYSWPAGTVRIGTDGGGSALPFFGMLSNFRIVRAAVYSGPFAPPTSALTAIADTSLLTLQDRTFKDNGPLGVTINTYGNPKTIPYSPFPRIAAYDPASHGGSIMFEGAAASISTSPIVAIGAQDFTLETWIYLSVAATSYLSIALTASFGIRFGDAGYGFKLCASCNLYSTNNIYNSSYTANSLTGRWTHVAFTRQSGECRLFVNGVNVNVGMGINPSAYPVKSWVDTTVVPAGAITFSNNSSLGYQSGSRLVIGTALYTSDFALPTSAPIAVPGTEVLLNYRGAAIYDVMGMMDLDALGGVKLGDSGGNNLGSTSIYFDGANGSYLTGAPGALNFNTSDFTVEFWYLKTAQADAYARLFYTGNGDTITGIELVDNSGTLALALCSTAGTSADICNVATVGLAIGTWYHIVLRRVGNTFSLFVNGTLVYSVYSSLALFYSATQSLVVGGQGAPRRSITGYINDLRVSIGKGRHTVEPKEELTV